MCEDVEKELNKTECSLADVNAELELIEEKINGGASLDRFILNDEDLKKVEDKLNEENDAKLEYLELKTKNELS